MNVDYFTKIIRQKGSTAKEFCQSLGTNYKSFRWRVRNGSLKLYEYKAIIEITEKTFEELFLRSVTSEDSTEQREQEQDTVEVKHKQFTSRFDGKKKGKQDYPFPPPKDNFIDTF